MSDTPDAPDSRAVGETTPPTLLTTAARVGSHRWVEDRLFALTGTWSAAGDEPAVRAFFSAQSAFHAWRAEQWAARRPRSVETPDAPLWEGWRDAVDAAAGLGSPPERLAAWAGVLQPALLVGYRRHLLDLAAAADGGLRRWLALALDDGTAGWLEGSELLGERLGRAADRQRAVEAEAAVWAGLYD